MTVPLSYVNGRTFRDALQGLAVSLDTDAIKVALYTDAISGCDKNALETYGSGAFASNQVSSPNYLPGGLALINPTTTTPSSGKWIFKENIDTFLQWSNVTFTARGAVVWDDTASDRVLAVLNLGADISVQAGTFTLNWDPTNGIFYCTY